ncbi:hypothetical protein MP638_004222, partial [Amoeboaphelidium occidentale]
MEVSDENNDLNEIPMPENLSAVTPLPKKSRRSFPVSKKRDVVSQVAQFKEQGIKTPIVYAARMNSIDIRLVSKWVKMSDKILDSSVAADTRKLHKGPALKYEEEELKLVGWITELRFLNIPVDNRRMAAYIMKERPGVFTSFQHCYRWTYDMMKRNNLSIRRKTHNANHYSEEEMGS